MIFLIPIFVIFAAFFGVDYLYFSDENKAIKHEQKIKQINQSDINKYIKELIKC